MASIIATLGINISKFTAGLNAAKQEAAEAAKGISGPGASASLGLFGGVALAAITAAAHQTLELGSRVQDLSMRLGMSTSDVQAWDFALKQSGSSMEDASAFLEKLSTARNKAARGDEDAQKALAKLGVTMDMVKNSSLRSSDLALVISDAFETGDPDQLIESLRVVGGRGAGAMVAPFRDGFSEMVQHAKDSGLVMSEETIASLDSIDDKFQKLYLGSMTGVVGPLLQFGEKAGGMMLQLGRETAAYFVGPSIGLVEGLQKFDIKHPFESAKNVGKSMVETTMEALEGLEQIKKKNEEVEAAKVKRLSNPKRAINLEDDDEVAKKKDAAEQKELDKLDRQLSDEERKGKLARMNAQERLDFLRQELELLKEKEDAETNPIEAKKLGLQIAKQENEIQSLEVKGAVSERKATFDRSETMSRGQYQSIGGVLGRGMVGQDLVQLEVARKSEGHLSGMKLSLTRIEQLIASKGGVSVFESDTQY